MPQEPAIRIEGLGKRFISHWILAHLDLKILPGESIALFGSNGCGKSTLLKIIGTLFEPTCGQVSVFGQDVRKDKKKIRACLRFLGHDKQFYPSLTLRENLELIASLLGLKKNDPSIESALDRLGIGPLAHRHFEEVSEGMKKRLALAKMLLGESDLILLDEPYPSLDSASKEILNGLIRQWRSEKKTLLMASHDHEQTLPHVDRVFVLEKGRLKETR
ncbi:MAG: ABC transporter ATP-binding protein [bacterium]|nr:ABC transporter ATP-binding protein [bacterium]